MFTHVKLYKYFQNMVKEGTVSQNVELGPSFYLLSKNRKLFVNFVKIFL